MNTIALKFVPELDSAFFPAVYWNREYMERVKACSDAGPVTFALIRPDGSCSRYSTRILPIDAETAALTLRYLCQMLKFLLWQRGAQRVLISGCDDYTKRLAEMYSTDGERAFDADFFGGKVYDAPFEIACCNLAELPEERESALALGRHRDGCRIGFDLGGSDRKCAAVKDGKVVFSEEVPWSPYFEKDPEYHIAGIQDSLERAAAHLPRVDAIGGSAAGVYVNNEVRVASLFRGLSGDDFDQRIRRVFFELQSRWGNVPFDVVNDGEVTALAGSMSLGRNAVLGISMGTSLAAGYVTPEGNITSWLNELAFAPVDYRENGPVDEWSGDAGCGVQYFSQQAVARLAPQAGFNFGDIPYAEQLCHVQDRMSAGDERAASIYSTIGRYLGYSLPHYADFYELENVLLLGRVLSGSGGDMIIAKSEEVLAAEFPDLAEKVNICTPGEADKRHGQAVAAASLPALRGDA